MTGGGPEARELAGKMSDAWMHFARTGDPNHPDAAATWPAFAPTTNDDDQRLQLAPGWGVLNDFRKEECAFWRAQYDRAFASP